MATKSYILLVVLVFMFIVDSYETSEPPKVKVKTKHCEANAPSDNGYLSRCHGTIKCPQSCPHCHLSCKLCGMAYCSRCDKVGSVCQDPRFIGGDGQMFYFHGYKDYDFCLVSDNSLHINAHFIGKRTANRTRDFTWIQAIGILFDSTHVLYVGSKRVGKWNPSVDQFVLYYDGSIISVPLGKASKWVSPNKELKILRVDNTNYLNIEISDLLNLSVGIVPVTKQDSRVHKYEITDADCFAHLEVNFEFFKLTDGVSGVLGQTYAPGFLNPVQKEVPMPVMGGEKSYIVSSIFTPDCEVSQFKAIHHSAVPSTTRRTPPAACTSDRAQGSGFVCKK